MALSGYVFKTRHRRHFIGSLFSLLTDVSLLFAMVASVVFMVAGLLAGMFGIGGGVIIVPLLLTIGTHPGVATSTSSAMMFFTNLASTSIYFAFGLILFDYAIVGFFVGFFSSFLGQQLMAYLRRARSASGRKFERNSYITFVIGGVVLVSAILMTIQYIFSIVEGPNEDYGSLCQGLRF